MPLLQALVARKAPGEDLSERSVDWLATVKRANDAFVAPALWGALTAVEAEAQLPADLVGYLTMVASENALRNERTRQQCLEIGARLADCGLSAVLLKGAGWLFDDGPGRADRMMRDIDILVADAGADRAVNVLEEDGYGRAPIVPEPGHFHKPALFRPGGLYVEVHVELSTRPDMLPAAEIIADATPVAPGLALPSPRHRIIHNVLHAQLTNGDYYGRTASLRDILDLSRLISRHRSDIDWQELARTAASRGYFHYLSGAIHIASSLFGSPLPQPFDADPRGRRHARACRFQRRWPLLEQWSRRYGVLRRAVAWERDSYSLGLGNRRDLAATWAVNRRRFERALWAAQRMLKR